MRRGNEGRIRCTDTETPSPTPVTVPRSVHHLPIPRDSACNQDPGVSNLFGVILEEKMNQTTTATATLVVPTEQSSFLVAAENALMKLVASFLPSSLSP